MDIKTLKIETVLKLKDKTLYGIILEDHVGYELNVFFNYLKNKKISFKQHTATIVELDGYRAKNNPSNINIFLVLKSSNNFSLNVGDVIQIA